jgi:hypothetical protein
MGLKANSATMAALAAASKFSAFIEVTLPD